MENDKERVSALNNKLNPAAARPQEERKAKCKNADNHDLGPWEELPIGDVPEVNGLWAVEMHEFVPTCAELFSNCRTLGARCDRTDIRRMVQRNQY